MTKKSLAKLENNWFSVLLSFEEKTNYNSKGFFLSYVMKLNFG